MNLITSSVFTSRSGIASDHFEKYSVIARMNRCPFAEGGEIGPMMSIPQVSNGHEVVDVCKSSGGWCM